MVSQEDVWVFPRDLLYISWAGLKPNRLFLDVSRQSRWILKQHCDADFEVYAKKIRLSVHLINTWKHSCLMIVTKPRVKGADNTRDLTAQKGVITRHFHNMAQNQCDRWARQNDGSPLLPQWRSVVRPKWPKQTEPKRCPNSGMRSISKHSNT